MARPKQFDPAQALVVAMDQFRRSGFDATSLADITKRTGVRKASLYATYGDKRTFFLSALQCYSEGARAELDRTLENCHDLRSVFRALVLSFVSPAPGVEPERACLCVNSAVEFGVRDPEVADRLSQHAHAVEDRLALAIADAQERGEVHSGLVPQEAARYVQIVLYGVIVAGRGCYALGELEQVVDVALDTIAPRHVEAEVVRARKTSAPASAAPRESPTKRLGSSSERAAKDGKTSSARVVRPSKGAARRTPRKP